MEMTKKYIIKTYGCQMNELDSERISYMLSSLGYEETDVLTEADLIIYNTCIVRKNAELKVYGHIGAMKALKEKNPDLVIAICGCMMEIKEAQDEIKNKYEHVDIVFGTKNINSLPYLLDRNASTKDRVFEVEETDDIDEVQEAIRHSGHSAYINIIYGCDNFCSYCIVPYTRGRETSRSKDSILHEIKSLADSGYKEVTLLGQNVNSYGKDLHPCTSFTRLIQEISQIEGIERIRFMSGHPKDFSSELIDEIAKNPKICPHVHLPLQSGSTRILKEMNRTYTKEDYLKLVDEVRDKIEGVTITSDIIVGFPGETLEDVKETIDVVNKSNFDQCYIYKYSKRVGTKAAEMENQVSEENKSEWFQMVLDAINYNAEENNSNYLNTRQTILVDGVSKNNPDRLTGRTETNKIVNFEGNKDLIGNLINIDIVEYNSFSLEGKLA